MIFIIIHSLFLISPIYGLAYDGWGVGTNTLPIPNGGMAVGQDDSGTAYLIGGSGDNSTATLKAMQSFVSFKDGVISDLAPSSIWYIYEPSQFYSQLNESLWMINPQKSISKFDTSTLQMTYTYSTIPGEGATSGCLASIDSGNGYLVTTGGGELTQQIYYDTVNVLDLGTSQWITAASLNVARFRHSCAVVDGFVYVIAGFNSTYLDSIEMTSFNDLLTQTDGAWNVLSATLFDPLYLSRAVVYLSDILVIGGARGPPSLGYNTQMNVIDTLTKTVSAGGNMNFAVMSPAAIIIDDVLYVFGGYGESETLDQYQYLVLPTESPSYDPTTMPTPEPTTAAPTIAYGDWTLGTNTLPFGAYQNAAAYDGNGTIYLLGGDSTKSLMSYKDGEFTSYGLDYFSDSIVAQSQYYSQLNDNLWIMDGVSITKFNIPTLQATFNYGNIAVPGDYAGAGCITTVDVNDGYLVLSGGVYEAGWIGFDVLDTVYLFDSGTSEWITTGSLNVARSDHSCESINGFVYILGGGSFSIEKASFNDLLAQSSSSWNEFSSSLTVAWYTLSVVHLDEILLYGWDARIGRDGEMNIINTITDTVRSGPSSITGARYPALINADGVLYAFGGVLEDSSEIDSYQYLVLPTPSPTNEPTATPTLKPTNEPTLKATDDMVVTEDMVITEETEADSTPSPVDGNNSNFAVHTFDAVYIVLVVLMAIFGS